MFQVLELMEDLLWGFLAAPLILLLGGYFSFKSRFVQVRRFPVVVKTFWNFLVTKDDHDEGIHPLKAFFACVGGCIGIGNIVSICVAAQLGGPGALFWIWVAALAGMMLKYSEVYLGVKFRVTHAGGYRGGPMYYLARAFRGPFIPAFSAFCLCIYGVEVYQFRVVTESLVYNFGWNQALVAVVLLLMVVYAALGGVGRVGTIASVLIPIFVVCYLLMGFWVLIHHLEHLPAAVASVFSYAFTGHAAVGGFLGSTLMLTLSQGVRRGAYSGDVGVGYASVIHSETRATVPAKQASLVIFDMFLDTFVVCTMTLLLILTTGLWKEPLPATILVQTALAEYFPHTEYFVPFFLFLLGYSTINAYFVVGLNSAEFLSPRFGKYFFYLYAASAFLFFAFAETAQALTLMALSGGVLLLINGVGIFLLRDEITYDI